LKVITFPFKKINKLPNKKGAPRMKINLLGTQKSILARPKKNEIIHKDYLPIIRKHIISCLA